MYFFHLTHFSEHKFDYLIYQAVLEKLSYRLIGRHDIERLMRLDAASACLPSQLGHSVSHSEAVGSGVELCELFLSLPSIKQVNFMCYLKLILV